MHCCGLEGSRTSTVVYIEDAWGRRVKRAIAPTTPAGLDDALGRFLKSSVRAAIEAGNETAWIIDSLLIIGYEVGPRGSRPTPTTLTTTVPGPEGGLGSCAAVTRLPRCNPRIRA